MQQQLPEHMVTGAGQGKHGVNGVSTVQSRLRIDKWLWFARIVKTRTLAAKLVTEGRIRVNSVRIETPAKAVGPGDVLTIGLDRDVRVLRIVANAERRGPYSEARLLYEDLG